jgi:histidinol-phosphate/aromatic aminotransferase/cobyric acid decarboxylase-like protein
MILRLADDLLETGMRYEAMKEICSQPGGPDVCYGFLEDERRGLVGEIGELRRELEEFLQDAPAGRGGQDIPLYQKLWEEIQRSLGWEFPRYPSVRGKKYDYIDPGLKETVKSMRDAQKERILKLKASAGGQSPDRILAMMDCAREPLVTLSRLAADYRERFLEVKKERHLIDFVDLEQKLSDPAVKMMFLCNPHNPVGRVYTRQELEKIYDLCQKHNVVIFADEIHSDFVYAGHTHVSMDALHTKGVITAIAPSKTFNLASLKTAVMICADEELWGPFKKDGELTGLGNVNIFGHIATVAAYTHGAAYVDAMMQHLTENVEILCRELETIPQINMMKPEGTYLMWLDCRALGLKNDSLVAFFANEAGVSMNGGTFFGPEGDGFVRMNIACPHATVCQAMQQIRSAVEKRALATV